MFQLLKSAKCMTDLLTQDVMRPSLNKEAEGDEKNVESDNEDLITEEQANLSAHAMMNDEV